jgi:hypothetical protein
MWSLLSEKREQETWSGLTRLGNQVNGSPIKVLMHLQPLRIYTYLQHHKNKSILLIGHPLWYRQEEISNRSWSTREYGLGKRRFGTPVRSASNAFGCSCTWFGCVPIWGWNRAQLARVWPDLLGTGLYILLHVLLNFARYAEKCLHFYEKLPSWEARAFQFEKGSITGQRQRRHCTRPWRRSINLENQTKA